MKHLIFILSLFFVNCINAQNFTEANIHLWGVGISHEKEITENISIRGSFNYDGKYYIVDNQLLPGAVSYYIFQPEFVIEPRWYHNKANREKNNKNVAFNANNFVGLSFAYGASWLNASNKGYYMYDSFTISPSYNFRRNIKNTKLIYEMGLGLRYSHYFKTNTNQNGEYGITANIKLAYVIF